MKSNLKKIGSLLALCVLAAGAHATIILNDNFDSYATGSITNVSSLQWFGISGVGTSPLNIISTGDAISSPNMALVAQTNAQDVAVVYSGGASFTTNSSANLYASFVVNMSVLTTNTGSSAAAYFASFYSTNGTGGGFYGRIWSGITNATSGNYRLGISDNGNLPAWFQMDLAPGQAYTVVVRYAPSLRQATLWVTNYGSAINNISPSTNANDAVTGTTASIQAFALRQSAGEGMVEVDNLLVGTGFGDVISGSANPPVILTQPQGTNIFAGSAATFSVFADGDATIGYQWYSITNSVTNGIAGATGSSVTLNNLATNQSGYYYAVITNAVGTNVTQLAQLIVSPTPIPPTITNQPASTVNILGDNVSVTVGAFGLPAVDYQWKSITNSAGTLITNNVAGSNVSGANSATLAFVSILTNQAGTYFCTITNSSSVGYKVTNSALATITVNPMLLTNISSLHAQIDPVTFAPSNTTSLFKVRGIVTTWSDMTGVASTLFYMQDGTGGIPVFWSGANASTNLPPAGALVEVVGPLSNFSGLLEISPVFTNSLHSVTIISTNTPASIPKAQPLIFDPLLLANTATMKQLEGSYFVASNVFVVNGGIFAGNVNEGITNIVTSTKSFTNSILNFAYTNGTGQSFTFFINASTDISGNARPSGPVTIYGILGYHTPEGFEFTPSRFADIISYVKFTNVMANARAGDLITNNYTELVVRPGESLTTHMSIGDAAGGIVTVTPSGPLPTGATWSGITSGATATATFSYTGNGADAGTYFPLQLDVTSTAGSAYSQFFSVYVPTADEQKIYITEILANPTTNPAAPYYNPLARNPVVSGIATNDQYVEIANLSGANWDGGSGTLFTLDTGTASSPVFSSFTGNGADLPPTGSLVVYGGNGTNNTLPTVPNAALSSGSLKLSTSGGVLVLRNGANGNGIPGYIVDRVVYSATDISTNGSLSRFPALTNGFAAQAYISTNHVTPGAQYDGGAWSSPTSLPQGVNDVTVTAANNQVILHFTANTTKASTLWRTYDLTSPFSVVNGGQFGSPSATFTETNTQSKAFYFISTQQ